MSRRSQATWSYGYAIYPTLNEAEGEWYMVHPEGFEPPTFWSEARRSIQLSYGCAMISSCFFCLFHFFISASRFIASDFDEKDSE